MVAYFAKAALVIVRNSAGSDSYIYQGAQLPEGVAKETIKSLLEQELITKDEAETSEQAPEVEPEVEAESEAPKSRSSK